MQNKRERDRRMRKEPKKLFSPVFPDHLARYRTAESEGIGIVRPVWLVRDRIVGIAVVDQADEPKPRAINIGRCGNNNDCDDDYYYY